MSLHLYLLTTQSSLPATAVLVCALGMITGVIRFSMLDRSGHWNPKPIGQPARLR